MRKSQAQREEQAEEVWSSFEAEEDPVDNSEEEEEEKEYPGSSDGYGSEEEEEDEDSPPASVHRLVTWSTPKKLVSQPKQKAHRSKGSGPGGSSQKRSKEQR